MSIGSLSQLQYEKPSSHKSLVTFLRLVRSIVRRTTGRGFGFTLRLMKRLLGDRLVTMRFADGSAFHFSLFDTYWNHFVFRYPSDYEPELRYLLRRLIDVDYTFIDCGANIGFWSVLVSSGVLGCKKVVAIEASAETFEFLALNRRANGERFSIFQNAVFSRDNSSLPLSGGGHAGRHLMGESSRAAEIVPSITLDSMVDHLDLASNRSIVVKLDVEGAEIEALIGASELRRRGALFIFEDHGRDATHSTSLYIMEKMEMLVFYVDENGFLNVVDGPENLDRIKTNVELGYNFVACNRDSNFLKILQ